MIQWGNALSYTAWSIGVISNRWRWSEQVCGQKRVPNNELCPSRQETARKRNRVRTIAEPVPQSEPAREKWGPWQMECLFVLCVIQSKYIYRYSKTKLFLLSWFECREHPASRLKKIKFFVILKLRQTGHEKVLDRMEKNTSFWNSVYGIKNR